ncbi:MAG: hypothetical protein AB1758_34015, partial [Candidatus Eremiobacterota bacterium]
MIVTSQAPSLAHTALPSLRAAGSEPAPSQPQDTVEKRNSEVGEGAKLLVGGVGGLLLVIPCLYAGVIGGAVVGSMLGLGFGPIAGAVASNGFMGMLGTVWSSTSTVAKAGMILGGVSGLVGGWGTASFIGDKIGALLGGGSEEP